MKKSVSVILPTYNEYGNIARLISKINKLFQPQEIIVIDDQSNDGTIGEVKKVKRQIKCVKIYINQPPLGLAKSIQKGIELADNKIVAWMDADFSHPPAILNEMYKRIRNHKFVIGSWLCQGGKDLRKNKTAVIRSFLVNKICQFLFGNTVTAYTSGFAMARKNIFNKYQMRGDYGEYFIDLVRFCQKKKYRICEVPFICVSRSTGISKTSPNLLIFLKRTVNYLRIIAATYAHCITFYINQ